MTLARQPDLFLPDPEPEMLKPQPEASPRTDPEKIRLELNALLEKARSATTMPWPERDARMWQAVFPQLANWLPPDEAHQLRLEFDREMQRLAKAA